MQREKTSKLRSWYVGIFILNLSEIGATSAFRAINKKVQVGADSLKMPSSIHSGISGRSIGSLASTMTNKSRKSMAASQKLKIKWWQRRPIIKTAYFLDLQKGSYCAAIFTLFQSIILLVLSLFDLYCLLEARPGSRHFRSFGFSFLFVYSGNKYVRISLILISFFLAISAIALIVTTLILIPALKKEFETKFRPWLYVMSGFICFRLFAIIFQSVANDLYFTYHQIVLALWFILIPINVFALLVVYSNYQELSDITKIEDMAKLKMSTLSSLQGSRTLSHMSHQSLDSYRHYGAVNSNPSPSYMRAAANVNQQPYANTGGVYNYMGSTYGGGSNLSSPAPSVLAHHSSTPSLRGGAPYTIPLEMFNLNRPSSVTSSNQQINQEFIWSSTRKAREKVRPHTLHPKVTTVYQLDSIENRDHYPLIEHIREFIYTLNLNCHLRHS